MHADYIQCLHTHTQLEWYLLAEPNSGDKMNAIKIKWNLYIKERVQQLHFIAYLMLCYVNTEQGSFRAQETTASYTNYYSFKISNYLPSAKREINFLYLKAIYSSFFFFFFIFSISLLFRDLFRRIMCILQIVFALHECVYQDLTCKILYVSVYVWMASAQWMNETREKKNEQFMMGIFLLLYI